MPYKFVDLEKNTLILILQFNHGDMDGEAQHTLFIPTGMIPKQAVPDFVLDIKNMLTKITDIEKSGKGVYTHDTNHWIIQKLIDDWGISAFDYNSQHDCFDFYDCGRERFAKCHIAYAIHIDNQGKTEQLIKSIWENGLD